MLFAIVLFSSLPAMAYDEKGEYFATGASSCGEFVANRRADDYRAVRDGAWVAGYITAYNLLTPDTHSIAGTSDLSSMLLWLDNYCQAKPLNILPEAMQALTMKLRPKRHRSGQK